VFTKLIDFFEPTVIVRWVLVSINEHAEEFWIILSGDEQKRNGQHSNTPSTLWGSCSFGYPILLFNLCTIKAEALWTFDLPNDGSEVYESERFSQSVIL
jgi:hypothetical protein